MKSHFKESFFIFGMFLWRDLLVQLKHIKDFLINYLFYYPVISSIAILYLQPNTYFGSGSELLGTTIYAGNILIHMMVLTYKLTVPLLFDLEHNKYINYQIIRLNPNLVLLQRIIFTTLFSFVMLIPYLPIAKLIFPHSFVTINTSWPKLYLVLLFGTFVCAAYHMLAIILIKRSTQLGTLWARSNIILIMFGGLMIPRYIMQEYSQVLGYIIRLNPLLYITEGLRRAILADQIFLPIPLCCISLFSFALVFIYLAGYFFKKRVDHI